MGGKSSKTIKAKPYKTASLGIPSFNRAEKLTEVVPVKLQPSVKKAIPKPQSAWIRRVIIEKLERIKNE